MGDFAARLGARRSVRLKPDTTDAIADRTECQSKHPIVTTQRREQSERWQAMGVGPMAN
jgi:hypothetical protein